MINETEANPYNLTLDLINKNIERLRFDHQIAVKRMGIRLNKSKVRQTSFCFVRTSETKTNHKYIILLIKLRMTNQYF